MSNRDGRKRLTLDLPEDVYRYIKHVVIEREITATRYILEALVHKMKLEGYDDESSEEREIKQSNTKESGCHRFHKHN